jgi:hypothetical protein
MSICQNDWRYLKSIVHKIGAEKIMEFGAGLSTCLMDSIKFVESITSYETNTEWGQKLAAICSDKVHVKTWDGVDIYDKLPQYDLVVVDGPMGKGIGGPGRQHSIRISANCADHVLVHDAARDEERHWAKTYLKPYFKLSGRSGHHESRFEYWVRRKDE